jgi:hypothetical protein
VSLSWRERQRVALQPDGVAVSVTRRMRSRAAPHGVWPCEETPAPRPWGNAVKTLAEDVMLAARRAPLSVVLSNRFCLFALIRRPPQITGEAESHSYAVNRMQSLYGDAAKESRLRLSDAGADAWLACCIPAALLQEVRDACAAKRARLVSVQPYFAAAWRRAGAAVRGKSGWFVVQEPKRLVAGFVSNGSWIHLVSRRSGERIEAVLDVLDRERELLPEHHDERHVWLYGAAPEALGGSHRDYRIDAIRPPDLDGLSSDERVRYAMAA